MKSPLTDKIVGLFLQKVKEENSKAPTEPMGLRFSFPIELRIDLTSLPQGWKEEVVPFLLEQPITYVRGSVCSVAEGSNRTGSNFFPGSMILFPSLLGPQENGGNETSLKAAEIGQWK
jgi:hypothetical protein